MIVEIGTSDFGTNAGKIDGLYIEPVKYYYDRLPDCNKLNIAISNYTGEVDVYYIPVSAIKEHGLPNWVRGCNCINEPHKTIVKNDWQKYAISDRVEVKRIKDVLDEQGIKAVEYLKIDTEGHDTIILNDYLDTVEFLPAKIVFESNELSDEEELRKIYQRLRDKGYHVVRKRFDTICTL